MFARGAQEEQTQTEVENLRSVSDGNIRDVLVRFNPELRALRHGVTASEFDVQQARLYPNPSMNLKIEEISLEDPEFDGGKRIVRISQKIELGGKRASRLGLAQERGRVAHLSYQARLEELVRDARSALVNVLFLRRTQELAACLAGLAKERLALAKTMREQGAMSENELLRVRVEAAELEVLLTETRKTRNNQVRELTRLLGLPQDAQVEFAGELNFPLPPDSVPGAKGGVSAEHPALRREMQDIAVAAAMQSIEKSAAIPDLHLDLMYSRKEETDDDMGGIGLGFGLPLFDRRQGAIKETESKVEAARAMVAHVEKNLSTAYSKALQNYEAALASARDYAEYILPDTKASTDLVQSLHAEGRVSANEVLEARGMLARTEMASIRRVAELYEAVIELNYLAQTGGNGHKPR
jgi:cobalt-zinc-cadmium efflux system outer membrane protein